MEYSLVRRTLRENRRAVIGWTAGIGLFVVIYSSYWASFRDDQQAALDARDQIPDGMATVMGGIGDLSSGAGYLQAVVFQLFVPLLVIGYAAVWGTRAIAGQEESGGLDLYMANPISRRRFVLDRFAAMTVGMVLLGVVVLLLELAVISGLGMNVGFAKISAICAGLLLLGMVFGTFALAVGAVIGRRSVVLAVTGVVALATYLLRAYGLDSDTFRALRWLSPFHYYVGNDPLFNGFSLGYLAVLVALVGVLAGIAVVAFERRDIGT